MPTYAFVINGKIHELITTEQDINTLYHPDFVAMMHDIGGMKPKPQQDWLMHREGNAISFTKPDS